MTPTPVRGRLVEPLTVGAIAAAGLLAVNPPDVGGPWCPSAILFGVACPLCGLTRGVSRFVRGDLAASIGFHPLAGVVVVTAGIAWLAWVGRRAGWWSWRSPAAERVALGLLGVGLVVVWAWRALTGTLPVV